MQAQTDDSPLVLKSLNSAFQELAELSSGGKRDITVVFLPHDAEKNSRISQRSEKSWLESSASAHDNVPRSAQTLPAHANLAPVCHASNSSCNEATNSCSGRGSCYLKSGSASEGSAGNCYACRCHQTVVHNRDGSLQTIQWGGPACEKKDISSSFWLIASVSILLVTVVGSGIGMLFSMGQQELPSVISTGVGGSKAQS